MAVLLAAIVSVPMACSHPLQVTNLANYSTPVKLTGGERRPNVAVLPFSGTPDALFYFNSIVEQLAANPAVGDVRTDFVWSKQGSYQPDLVLAIQPTVEYRSSAWNFLINWPGFLLFTPAWNGYVYRADILTQISISDINGTELGRANIPITYDIRQSEFDRTLFTGLSWFEVSAFAFFGGLYNANNFDRDIIPGLHSQVKGNYGTYVVNQIAPKVTAAMSATPTTPPVGGSALPYQ